MYRSYFRGTIEIVSKTKGHEKVKKEATFFGVLL